MSDPHPGQESGQEIGFQLGFCVTLTPFPGHLTHTPGHNDTEICLAPKNPDLIRDFFLRVQ